jgi:hypothetical protein
LETAKNQKRQISIIPLKELFTIGRIKKKAPNKETGKKDFRHTKKPTEKKGYVARNQAPGAKPKTQGSRSRSR